MARKNDISLLHVLITILVLAIVGGAFWLSAMAVTENLRFTRASDQILQISALVHTTAATQKDFAQTVGEDVLADLQHIGQIIPDSTRINPWIGEIRTTLFSPTAMRIETDLPVHECRRLALYFINYPAPQINVQKIEAQAVGDTTWTALYPSPASHAHPESQVDAACGKAKNARLALLFQIR